MPSHVNQRFRQSRSAPSSITSVMLRRPCFTSCDMFRKRNSRSRLMCTLQARHLSPRRLHVRAAPQTRTEFSTARPCPHGANSTVISTLSLAWAPIHMNIIRRHQRVRCLLMIHDSTELLCSEIHSAHNATRARGPCLIPRPRLRGQQWEGIAPNGLTGPTADGQDCGEGT